MRKIIFTILLLSITSPGLLAETVLITGSNKGIGLEFTTQYLEKGWEVIATHRRDSVPDTLSSLKSRYKDQLRIEKVDITIIPQVKDLGRRLDGVSIDVLINNAGFGGEFHTDRQSLGSLDYDTFETIMRTNGLGALAVTEALTDNVLSSEHKKIIAITSTLASFTAGPPAGGGYWYRMSKAALHMTMLNMSKDLKESGAIVTMLSPGVIYSEKNVRRGVPEAIMLDGEMSIGKLIKLIDELTPADNGKFISYEGKELGL